MGCFSLFQALVSWGRAKETRASERKNGVGLRRGAVGVPRPRFFSRSSTTEILEQARDASARERSIEMNCEVKVPLRRNFTFLFPFFYPE